MVCVVLDTCHLSFQSHSEVTLSYIHSITTKRKLISWTTSGILHCHTSHQIEGGAVFTLYVSVMNNRDYNNGDYQPKINYDNGEIYPLEFPASPEQAVYCENRSDNQESYPLSFEADILEEGVSREPGRKNNQDVVRTQIESCKQSYCPSPSTADSPTQNHGLYQPHNVTQHHTVMVGLYGHFDKETGLRIKPVAFYPFDQSKNTNNALGWDKPENKSAAVNAINKALGTLHTNGSLYIRFANETATRISTRVTKGETVGPPVMQFFNSMTSHYGVNTFKLDDKDDSTVCGVSFREGTWKRPSALGGVNETADKSNEWERCIVPSGTTGNTGGTVILRGTSLTKICTLIDKGIEGVSPPKTVSNFFVGSVPIWTAGQRAV